MIKFLSIFILMLLLSACTHFSHRSPIRNYDKDYQHARSIPPLQMPSGIKSSGIDSFYPVPTHPPTFTQQPSLIPPGNPGAASSKMVKNK